MFRDAMEEIMKAGDTANAPVEGDYKGADGLWYCGKCHTKKQTEIVLPWGVKRPMCLCKCESERIKREDAERKRRAYAAMVEKNRRAGFADYEMSKWTFANDDGESAKLTAAMQRYVDNFADMERHGKGLLLYGSCGTGKTYAACEVANALIDRGVTVLVTNFARLINDLQGNFERQAYIDGLNYYRLLVIDDLGVERNTEYAKEQVYNIIDGRYRAGMPMIITTNLSMDKMSKPDDMDNLRIYDRILERCYPIKVDGVSRRKKAVMADYASMRDLLGL